MIIHCRVLLSKRSIYLSRVLFGGHGVVCSVGGTVSCALWGARRRVLCGGHGTISTAFIRGYCADRCVRHRTISYGPSFFDDSLRQGSMI